MNLRLKSFIYSLVVLFMFSCETLDINPRNNPNALTPDATDPDLLLNSVQIGLTNTFWAFSGEGSQLTRMTALGGPLYANSFTPVNLDDEWRTVYSSLLADVEALIPEANAKGLPTHLGVAKIAKAYAYTTLVDFFNDVPFTEATKGLENLNPKTTPGNEIYAGVLTLLDEAIADLSKTPEASNFNGTDLFFGGAINAAANRNKWIKVANTLKFRMYVQGRLYAPTSAAYATAAQALANDASLISTATDDFVFEYGTNLNNPDSRHPLYGPNYDNGSSIYQSIGYMNLFTNGANFSSGGSTRPDPRSRYYFYRQETSNTTNVNNKRCITQSKPTHFSGTDVFCLLTGLGTGYWGRDHGDNAGIPPDNRLRTIYGVYPAGGRFDANDDTGASQGDGAGGRGIAPILQSFGIDFLRAEAALTMGTADNPRTLLEKGIRASISKVITFGQRDPGYTSISIDTDNDNKPDQTPQQRYEPSTTVIDDYVTARLTEYDAADNNGKLNIIITEMYKAGYGNGIDSFNAYRRTGYPKGLQPMLQPAPGNFLSAFFYPAVYVNTNSNASQRTVGGSSEEKPFWQTINNSALK